MVNRDKVDVMIERILDDLRGLGGMIVAKECDSNKLLLIQSVYRQVADVWVELQK